MHLKHEPTTGLLFSGGIDSAVLLDQLVRRGHCVVPIYVRSGCAWEDCELSAGRCFLAAMARPRLLNLVTLELPLDDLYGDHWSMTGIDVPDESSPDEAVYLPGRNPLLLIKPALWCWMQGIERLALATLSNNPFEDATPAFFARFQDMLREATGAQLEFERPFAQMSKWRVLEAGRHLPLELTFSCLAPVEGLHCGHCNKCQERRQAFCQLLGDDPTPYAGAVQAPCEGPRPSIPC